MRDAEKRLRYLDQAMNDSVGSVQMKLLSSRVIDCPRVECSASPFSGSCPFLNDNMFMLLCVFVLLWDGSDIFSVRINVLCITNNGISGLNSCQGSPFNNSNFAMTRAFHMTASETVFFSEERINLIDNESWV